MTQTQLKVEGFEKGARWRYVARYLKSRRY